MKNIKTFRKVKASIVNEKLKAKKPNDNITIDVDLDYDVDSNDPQDKNSEKIFKKYKLKVEPNGATDVSFDMSGKKKDLINYLQSQYYSYDDEDVRDLYPELLEAFDDPAWFEAIAKDALKQLQRHHKWKDMELSAEGPGNKKNYMDMAITSSKKRGQEYEFKVHFDKNNKVTKIEELPSPWGESVDEAGSGQKFRATEEDLITLIDDVGEANGYEGVNDLIGVLKRALKHATTIEKKLK